MTVLAVLSTPNTAQAPDSVPRRIVSFSSSLEIEAVQFERDGTVAIPYFWMQGMETSAFEPALREDPRITSVDRLEETGEKALYKAVWEVDSPLIRYVASANGVVMRARGGPEEWRLKVWFENRADVSSFRQHCDDDVPLCVERIGSLADTLSQDREDLSDRQREVLALAYREGYFDRPRGVTQEEFAEELDVSTSAVGAVLRRGVANLVEDAIE